MSTTSSAQLASSESHPWLLAFSVNPDAEFDRLVHGYAEISPYTRAEAPDAAAQLFGGIDSNDSLWELLDNALLNWIIKARTIELSATVGRRRRQINMVIDALRIVHRLKRVSVASRLFDDRVLLTDWLSSLREGNDCDARDQFFITLAVMQGDLHFAGCKVEVLAPLWRDLCAHAGSSLPKIYLSTGLLGLRNLPRDGQQSDVADWLAGLLIWAISQQVDERTFIQKWKAMKSLYPRTPQKWRTEVSRLLAERKIQQLIADSDSDVRDWWFKDSDLAPLVRDNAVYHQGVTCPTIDDFNALAGSIRSAPQTLPIRLIDSFAALHVRFARSTGYDDFLCVAFDRIGRVLVGMRNQPAALKAVEFAREMLRWQPFGSHGWSLWADALEAYGAIEASEMVRREHLRRIPFKAAAYTQLAEFLIATNRTNEALQIVERAECISFYEADVKKPDPNAVVRAIKLRIISSTKGLAAANALFLESKAVYPTHETWPSFEKAFNRGEELFLTSQHYGTFPLRELSEPSVETQVPFAHMAKAFGLSLALDRAEGDASSEVTNLLGSAPEFAFAKLLAARHNVWNSNAHLPGFAVSFELALLSEDQGKLSELAEQMPRLEALILLAKAIFGDVDPAAKIEAWLNLKREMLSEPPLEELRHWLKHGWNDAQRATAGNVISFANFVAAAGNRKKLMVATRQVHEAVIAGELLAA